MSIVEIRGGPLTHKKLVRRSKDDLANVVMACKIELEAALKDDGIERDVIFDLLRRIYYG